MAGSVPNFTFVMVGVEFVEGCLFAFAAFWGGFENRLVLGKDEPYLVLRWGISRQCEEVPCQFLWCESMYFGIAGRFDMRAHLLAVK